MRILAALLAVMMTVVGAWAQDASTQIIGGTIVPDGNWPATVGILRRNVSSNFDAQFCGGSLIGKRYVLTAAHCVDDVTAGSVDVLVGTLSLASGGRRVHVSRVFVHPNWNTATSDYDVALLKLSNEVTGIEPVKLIASTQESTYARAGTPVWVMGWGDVDIDADEQVFPKLMRQVRLALISRGVCNDGSHYGGGITSRMICAGPTSGAKDSCQGDSGGPLMGKDSSGRYRLQIGVVSWGNGCAVARYPGVYTRVAYFRSWITSTMAANP